MNYIYVYVDLRIYVWIFTIRPLIFGPWRHKSIPASIEAPNILRNQLVKTIYEEVVVEILSQDGNLYKSSAFQKFPWNSKNNYYLILAASYVWDIRQTLLAK